MNQTWLEVGLKFGIPTLVLLAVGYATYRLIIPFLIRHFEKSQELLQKQLDKTEDARKADQSAYFAALERRDELSRQLANQHQNAMNAVATEMRALTDEIKDLRRDKPSGRR